MELMARPAVSGKAGSIFSEMPPIPRPHGGLDYLADRPYNPLTDSPWERARWRQT
jgi:hypothetical protein